MLVVGHNGSVVYHRAYGNRAVDPAIEAMTEDTVFDMASLVEMPCHGDRGHAAV